MKFHYSGQDNAFLLNHSGHECEIVRELTADEVDGDDVGKMFEIIFEDGFTTDAFEDALKGG